MAAHIRLIRMGKKKSPYYRIIVLDERKQRDSDYIDCLGYYHPIEGDNKYQVDVEKYNEWISKGAQPSRIVTDLVRKATKASS